MEQKLNHDPFKKLGPGIITGASDDDPSGIATYSQAGAGYGYSFLWSVFFTLPFMIAVQELCARIALVTGRGLAANVKKRYGRPIAVMAVCLLLVANMFNLGADLGMMASATQLVLPVPFIGALIVIALLTLQLQIFTSYATYARYLKWLTLSLFAYMLVAFSVNVDWSKALLSTVVPHLTWNKESLMLLVALFGTTISPYLFFWQANQEIEEEGCNHGIFDGCHGALKEKLRAMRLDTGVGMVFSNVMSWFIILATGAVLFANGGLEIATADQAARALAPLAGPWASLLFTLGILGTGLLAVPIFSSTAAYAIADLFNLSQGLDKKWHQAKIFYAVIIAATILGGLLNFIGISPVRALIYAAVANGVVAPVLIFLIVHLASDKKTMGEHRARLWAKIFGWGGGALMAAAAVAWLILALR